MGSKPRRRAMAVVLTLCVGLGSAAALASGLVSCRASEPVRQAARPLSADEAARLAVMRLHNYRDGHVGLRGTLGKPGEELRLVGWIDWRQPLAYLAVTGPTPGPADGLVQAIPGLVAVRPGRIAPPDPASPAPPASPARPASLAPPANPTRPPSPTPPGHPPSPTSPAPLASAATGSLPLDPPADGWTLRGFGPTGPTGAPLDTLLAYLFSMASDQPDAADLLARGEARWLGKDRAGEVAVDVLLGPALPPTAPSPTPVAAGPQPTTIPSTVPSADSLAAQGGAVRYWLDGGAGLRRLEGIVGTDVPVRLDLDRADRRAPVAIGLLGGRAVTPRPVTEAEAAMLARVRQRDRAAAGGVVALVLPGPTGTVTATGWLDWRASLAYLAVHEAGGQTLLRADRDGVATLSGVPRSVDGLPPVPRPRGAWQRARWADRSDAGGASDLDLLVGEALASAGPEVGDIDALRKTAVWLRLDVVAGVPVVVYEVPKPIERGVSPGMARIRYWIDTSGVMRRLEVRTRVGGFGRLDLTLGVRVPPVPPV